MNTLFHLIIYLTLSVVCSYTCIAWDKRYILVCLFDFHVYSINCLEVLYYFITNGMICVDKLCNISLFLMDNLLDDVLKFCSYYAYKLFTLYVFIVFRCSNGF